MAAHCAARPTVSFHLVATLNVASKAWSHFIASPRQSDAASILDIFKENTNMSTCACVFEHVRVCCLVCEYVCACVFVNA